MTQIKPESYLDVALALQQVAIDLTVDGNKPSYEIVIDKAKEYFNKYKEL